MRQAEVQHNQDGDELFTGYDCYFWGHNIWQKIGWMPPTLRQIAVRGLTSLSPQSWDRVFTNFSALLPAKLKQPTPGEQLHKLAEVSAVPNPEVLYACLVSH